MNLDKQPNPRWSTFIQVFDENHNAIGFNLPDNTFLFKYDEAGGWFDEKGQYYNAQGILITEHQDQQNDDHDDSEQDLQEDQLVDQFQKILKEQQYGYRPEEKNKKKQTNFPTTQQQKQDQFNYSLLLEKYRKKQNLRQQLPAELFIYFKQKVSFYQPITPIVQKQKSVEVKNKAIVKINDEIMKIREKLIQKYSWLKGENVFLDHSGDSEIESKYERYWYGNIKTTQDKYEQIIHLVNSSEEFKILTIKTYYSLKSKFYTKKNEPKIKEKIKEMKQQIQAKSKECSSVTFLLDNLPQNFPCSYVFDLVQYSGGFYQDIVSVIIEDNFSATVTVLMRTAFKILNLQAFNHDKNEFIQLTIKQFGKLQKPKFYYITIDSDYKIHETELHDTLGLQSGKLGLVKSLTQKEEKIQGVRFAIGSINALLKVLMFRGQSMNVARVLPNPLK